MESLPGWAALDDDARAVARGGTEAARSSAFHAGPSATPGLFLAVLTDTPVFLSRAQLSSDSGWPAFAWALEGATRDVVDARSGVPRIEVRAGPLGEYHMGHRFRRSSSSSGWHYCVNGCLLRFVALDDLPPHLAHLAPLVRGDVADAAEGAVLADASGLLRGKKT